MRRLPQYVFRGTTINHEGNLNCRNFGYTCTSKDPRKATLFAMECSRSYPDDAVVYIAKTKKLLNLRAPANWNKKNEEELIWKLPPVEFYKLTEGYVRLNIIKDEFRKMGLDIKGIPRKENLSELCKELGAISSEEKRKLLKALKPFIEKP